MESINLLPEVFKLNRSVVKLSKTLKKVSAIVFVLLALVVSVSIGGFFVYKNRLNELTAKQNELKSQIKALKETEQRLVLVKDRLERVGNIYAKETPYKSVLTLEELIKQFPEGAVLETTSISVENLGMQVEIDSTSTFESMLDILIDSQLFDRIELTSLSYGPDTGYKIGLLLKRANNEI